MLRGPAIRRRAGSGRPRARGRRRGGRDDRAARAPRGDRRAARRRDRKALLPRGAPRPAPGQARGPSGGASSRRSTSPRACTTSARSSSRTRSCSSPAGLNATETHLMRSHTVIGADILAGSALPAADSARAIARHHHERWDGSGYPDGLAGEAIPLAARVAALADVYDALTHDRPYKRRVVPRRRRRLHRGRARRTQFDPRLTDLFLAMMAGASEDRGALHARHLRGLRRRLAQPVGDPRPALRRPGAGAPAAAPADRRRHRLAAIADRGRGAGDPALRLLGGDPLGRGLRGVRAPVRPARCWRAVRDDRPVGAADLLRPRRLRPPRPDRHRGRRGDRRRLAHSPRPRAGDPRRPDRRAGQPRPRRAPRIARR